MGGGVIHGDAAVLHQQQHEEDHRHQQQLGTSQQPFVGRTAAQHAGQGKRIVHAQGGTHAHQGQQAEEEHRLGQGREGGLAAGAHAFKGRTGIQGGQHGQKAAQTQQIGGQQKVAGKTQRRGHAAQGQQGKGAEHRGQAHHRAQSEDRRGHLADDLALAQALEDVEVQLQHRLAVPACHLGLDTGYDARQQRRQQQGQRILETVEGEIAHACSPQASNATSVARM